MLVAALLLPLLSVALADNGLPRSAIPKKELDKCVKDVAAYFDAVERETTDMKARAQQQAALDAITKAVNTAGKRLKVDAPLKYPGDWDYVLEAAKAEDKVVKAQCGKGLFRHRFTDKYDNSSAACLLSLPAGYAKGEELLPVVLALKPVLGLRGAALEDRARAMAEAMYADILATHIVLVPLGPEVGDPGKAEATEVEGSWFELGNLRVMFKCLRILLEQVRFDRSRLVLDGWGDAGLDALQITTNLPSWFAGVINRSGELGGDDMLFENLGGVPLLYVAGQGDGGKVDTAALAARKDVPAGVTVVDEPGSALAPSEATRTAVTGWLAERQRNLAPSSVHFKFADQQFQYVDWITALRISKPEDSRPGDPDFPRIDAKVDRATNRITLETVNVLQINLFLSDALVDLDKPVVISVNGKDRAPQKFTRDLRAMFDTRFNNADGYNGLYTASTLIEEIAPNAPARAPGKKKGP